MTHFKPHLAEFSIQISGFLQVQPRTFSKHPYLITRPSCEVQGQVLDGNSPFCTWKGKCSSSLFRHWVCLTWRPWSMCDGCSTPAPGKSIVWSTDFDHWVQTCRREWLNSNWSSVNQEKLCWLWIKLISSGSTTALIGPSLMDWHCIGHFVPSRLDPEAEISY